MSIKSTFWMTASETEEYLKTLSERKPTADNAQIITEHLQHVSTLYTQNQSGGDSAEE